MYKLNEIQNELWAHQAALQQQGEPSHVGGSRASDRDQDIHISRFSCVNDHMSILNNLYNKWPKDRIVHDKANAGAISIRDHGPVPPSMSVGAYAMQRAGSVESKDSVFDLNKKLGISSVASQEASVGAFSGANANVYAHPGNRRQSNGRSSNLKSADPKQGGVATPANHAWVYQPQPEHRQAYGPEPPAHLDQVR